MADFASSLTVGESLLVVRRRLGVSQETIAKGIGLTRTVYSRMERDLLEPDFKVETPKSLQEHEVAMIMRRRAGHTQKEVASSIGLSRHWVSKMENGKAPCERLVGGMND